MANQNRIIRTWKGWTSIQNAPIYSEMLVNEVFPAVKKRGVDGLEKVSVSTQIKGNEVEFFLTLQFRSIDDVKSFAGEDYETAYIPDIAKAVLSRYDEKAEHYNLVDELVFL